MANPTEKNNDTNNEISTIENTEGNAVVKMVADIVIQLNQISMMNNSLHKIVRPRNHLCQKDMQSFLIFRYLV